MTNPNFNPVFIIIVCRSILASTIAIGLAIVAYRLLIEDDSFGDVVIPFLQLQAIGIGVIVFLIVMAAILDYIANRKR